MSQQDIRSLFGKKIGRGDDDRTESEMSLSKQKKRKSQQKYYDEEKKTCLNFKHVQKQCVKNAHQYDTGMINP